MTYRVLALDGGGIKGLFTATLLGRLRQAHPQLLANTNLFAGTSTGGILALGLAAGKTPEELAQLYRTRARRIFDDSFWDNLVDIGNAAGADYDCANPKKELVRVFQTATLDSLGKRVVVPAFDLDADASNGRPRAWKAKFFTSDSIAHSIKVWTWTRRTTRSSTT